jgi:hypothetical protein
MKIYIEDNQPIPAVKVLPDGDPPPTGYTEATSIVDIQKYGEEAIDLATSGWYDKKCVREKLKTAVYTKMQIVNPEDVNNPTNWNYLDDAEKSIACHWFFVGNDAFFDEVKNDDRYWTCEAEKYREWTEVVRRVRLNLMEALVFRRTNDLGYAKDILADLDQITKDTVIDIDDITKKLNTKVRGKKMTSMYISGLESEENDGIVAIVDYINSTVGTAFEGNGFRGLDPTKFKTGHTPDTVADELLTIVDNEW